MKSPVIKKLLLGLLALLLLAGFGWVVASNGPLAPVKVTLSSVSQQPIEASVFGIGTVEARYNYRLGPTAAGRVKQVLADVGDSVQAGQVVAEMDAVDLDARIQAAGLAVERAKASIATAEASFKLADTENRRTASLVSRQLVSQSNADARQQEAGIAKAALDVARKEQQRLQAEQQALQQQLANLSITAPVAGIITSRDAEPGTSLVAGQAILTLADPQSYWVKARIDQSQAQGLQTGQAASIVLRSNPQQSLSGKLVRIEPLSDSITEERIVAVAFDQSPTGLSPGELAEATILTSQKADALVIPNAALRQLDGQTGVWKTDAGNTLSFVSVQTGIRSLDGQVEILGGLQVGDQVVTYASKVLDAGSKIKVVDSLAGSGK
jgi:HlyD family secretion protein